MRVGVTLLGLCVYEKQRLTRGMKYQQWGRAIREMRC